MKNRLAMFLISIFIYFGIALLMECNSFNNGNKRKMANDPSSQLVSSADNNLEDTNNEGTLAIYAGAGLVATGGAGAVIVGVNNKNKKKNTPVKEIRPLSKEEEE